MQEAAVVYSVAAVVYSVAAGEHAAVGEELLCDIVLIAGPLGSRGSQGSRHHKHYLHDFAHLGRIRVALKASKLDVENAYHNLVAAEACLEAEGLAAASCWMPHSCSPEAGHADVVVVVAEGVGAVAALEEAVVAEVCYIVLPVWVAVCLHSDHMVSVALVVEEGPERQT